MKIIWSLILGLLGLNRIAHSEEYQAQVTRVVDGDTIYLSAPGRDIKVRMVGIDAPELNQPYGAEARDALTQMVKGKTVRVIAEDRDRYGRIVGRVFLGNLDVNLAMIRQGYAWVYRNYTTDQNLYSAETEAQNSRRGLWADKQKPMPPWKWRAQERNGYLE